MNDGNFRLLLGRLKLGGSVHELFGFYVRLLGYWNFFKFNENLCLLLLVVLVGLLGSFLKSKGNMKLLLSLWSVRLRSSNFLGIGNELKGSIMLRLGSCYGTCGFSTNVFFRFLWGVLLIFVSSVRLIVIVLVVRYVDVSILDRMIRFRLVKFVGFVMVLVKYFEILLVSVCVMVLVILFVFRGFSLVLLVILMD